MLREAAPVPHVAPRFALRVRKRNVLRASFGVVIALLAFSTFQAYRIQGSLSEEAVEIYHRHVRQDELLTQLRRTLWVGANASRDYLVSPGPATIATLSSELEQLRSSSHELLEELNRLPAPRKATPELKVRIQDFWNVVASIPLATQHLDGAGRYRFIQNEIVPRRNAVGDLVREFTQVSQDALKESELEFARSRRLFAQQLLLVLGLCLACGLAVAGYSLMYSENLEKQTIRQYEEVERAKSDLERLSARLMEIQEEERTLLARELHDEIGQMLATLRLEISRAESMSASQVREIQERIARARQLAEKTVATVRNISLLLRPALLDDLGLGPALQWQVEDFTRRTGVPCELTESGLADVLPDTVRTCVYRVLQESLHNCEKHASATNVKVSVRQSAELLAMEIEDDGGGFELDSRRMPRRYGGHGILGMRERASSLGGSLELDSAPGRGTKLRLRLPLPTSVPVPNKTVEVRA